MSVRFAGGAQLWSRGQWCGAELGHLQTRHPPGHTDAGHLPLSQALIAMATSAYTTPNAFKEADVGMVIIVKD